MVHSSSNITVVSFNCDITNLEKDLTGDTSDTKDGNINHQDSGDSGQLLYINNILMASRQNFITLFC